MIRYIRQRTDARRATEYSEFKLIPMPHEKRDTMPMISLMITLLVIGVILWLSNSYLPIDGTIKKMTRLSRMQVGVRRPGEGLVTPVPVDRLWGQLESRPICGNRNSRSPG
jgi:hypothetical protein